MLVAVQRMSQAIYDAILVDWDQEQDAIRLLKTAREQKTTSQALNLALVQNDKDLPRALQHGANSAIRKPIDSRQAKDTLSTARDLILSRRSEQKTKEERAAAAQAALAAAAAEVPVDNDEPPAPKTGFLAQTAPRSAFDAAESTEPQVLPNEPPQEHVAQASAQLQAADPEPEVPQPPQQKRWDEKPKSQAIPSVEVGASENHTSQDSTRVFSSLPEEESAEPFSHQARQSRPRYWIFALVGCLLIAAVLWVWAPGDSYLGRISSLFHSLSRSAPAAASQAATTVTNAPAAVLEQPPPPAAEPPSAPEDTPATGEPGPIESSEGDPGNLQVIETKSIPKPGAQQPATTDAPPEPAQAQPETTVPSQPASNQALTPSVATFSSTPPPPQPAFVPVTNPQTRPAMPVHETPGAPSAGRSGVIIPDSLKAAPAQAPVNTVDSGVVPEEISRGLVVNRVEPLYPAQALAQRLEGTVILQVWVARDGSVQDVKLMRGNFALARAAFDAVRQWRFKPYAPNGRPVDFQTIVTLNFKYPG
jgi:protein TonB